MNIPNSMERTEDVRRKPLYGYKTRLLTVSLSVWLSVIIMKIKNVPLTFRQKLRKHNPQYAYSSSAMLKKRSKFDYSLKKALRLLDTLTLFRFSFHCHFNQLKSSLWRSLVSFVAGYRAIKRSRKYHQRKHSRKKTEDSPIPVALPTTLAISRLLSRN